MKPNKIVVHHSATKDGLTVSWNAIRRYHVDECSWRDIGYHFGIELVPDSGDAKGSYEVLLGRMPDDPGAHTSGHNQDSLGVCFVGNFDEAPPPVEQWKKGVELVAWLCREFGISITDVYPHNRFANKTCPGKQFDMARFKVDLIGKGVL